MKTIRILLVGAAVAFSGQALAFQETTAGRKPAETRAAEPATPQSGLNAPEPAVRSQGQEIRVPGLGTIGALPKLDFGLELLYGAGEPKGAREEFSKDNNEVQIRGMLKYRFPPN